MKKMFYFTILILSLVFNGAMVYHYSIDKPSSSIVKLGFSEYNIEIYCEKENTEPLTVNFNEDSYKIGKAEIIQKEELILVSDGKEINLSQKESDAFVINSNGDILYQLVKDDKANAETVFATPSGKKYHYDTVCAGSNAFEVELKIAKLFGRSSCSICVD